MYKKKIGCVAEEERDEIQALFERRNGLTGHRFRDWWERMSLKYQWESSADGRWEINFDTCEILLVTLE